MDIAIFNVFKIGRLLQRPHLGELMFIAAILFWGTSPYALLFYSDTFELPLISGLILVVILIAQHHKIQTRVWLAALYSLLVFIAYEGKPTSLVFSIAAGIVLIVYLLKEEINTFKRLKWVLLYGVVSCLVLGIGTLIYNNYLYNDFTFDYQGQTYNVDPELQMSPYYFAMMGLDGVGGYNDADAQASRQIASYDDRVNYNKQGIQERLSNYGFVGYLKFLSIKFMHNSADGDFDWTGDNLFQTKAKNSPSLFAQFVYTDGKYRGLMNNINQITWIMLLLFCCFGAFAKPTNKLEYYMLRLSQTTIIGGDLFLLIFEGGQTRYLLMWVPLFILIGSYGLLKYQNSFNLLNVKLRGK